MGGANIPLVALAQQADPLAEYARAAGLQSALAQQKAVAQQTQLENQQKQQALNDQQVATKTLQTWDGKDLGGLLESARTNGISAPGYMGLQKNIIDTKTNLNKLSDEDFAHQQKISDLTQGVHDQVSQAPPELKQDVYSRALETLQKAGVNVSKESPQYPGDEVFAQHLPAIRLHSALVAEAQKDREVSAQEQTAQAKEDAAKKPTSEEQNFQSYYKTKLAAQGLPPSAAEELKARDEFRQEKRNVTEVELAQRAAAGDKQAEAALKRLDQSKLASRPPRNDQATSDAIEAAAQSLAKMDPKDLTRLKDIASLRGDQRLLIYNRAKEINPNFSTSEVDRKVKMFDSFTNGHDGQQLQSFGTFLEHAGEASRVTNEFRNTSTKLVNTPLNKMRDLFGDATYSGYIASLEPVRKEFEGFLLGGKALYGDDRRAAEAILNDNSSPAQIQAALKQMGHTVKARQNEINQRFKNVFKSDMADVLGPMSPEALEGARQIGVEMSGGGQGGGAGDLHVIRIGPKRYQYKGSGDTADLANYTELK